MAEPFLAELRMMSFVFPPKGWALANGQLMPINQNQALFSLLGTMYGGNGQTTFGLPNLQGRVPISMGSGHTLGEVGGQQAVTLSISQIPTHVHTASGTSTGASTGTPSNTLMMAKSTPQNLYAAFGSPVSMAPNVVANVGGSQAHLNMQPFLTISFCIALQGIFPSQN
jgi:microcystin-dependent protein